jgi:hypothetical protein
VLDSNHSSTCQYGRKQLYSALLLASFVENHHKGWGTGLQQPQHASYWLTWLHYTCRLAFAYSATVYFVQGILKLSSLAVTFFLKDNLKMEPTQVRTRCQLAGMQASKADCIQEAAAECRVSSSHRGDLNPCALLPWPHCTPPLFHPTAATPTSPPPRMRVEGSSPLLWCIRHMVTVLNQHSHPRPPPSPPPPRPPPCRWRWLRPSLGCLGL